MSLLKKKKVNVTAPNPTFKVKYLGNVATAMVQGDDSTSRPVKVLWDNHVKTGGSQCVPMTVSVDGAGISVRTETAGATKGADRAESMHYWCHRISTFTAVKEHSGLFVWIYRHAGKNMKVDLRCHAVLCKNDRVSSELNDLLAKVLQSSLSEYVREKQQSQRRRSLQEKVAGFFSRSKPLRKQLLSPGKNYKPPIEYYFPPPQLDVIKEDRESCTSDEADEGVVMQSTGSRFLQPHNGGDEPPPSRSQPTRGGMSSWQPRSVGAASKWRDSPSRDAVSEDPDTPPDYVDVCRGFSVQRSFSLYADEEGIVPFSNGSDAFRITAEGTDLVASTSLTTFQGLLAAEGPHTRVAAERFQDTCTFLPLGSPSTAEREPAEGVVSDSTCSFGAPEVESSHDVAGLARLVKASHLSDVHYL